MVADAVARSIEAGTAADTDDVPGTVNTGTMETDEPAGSVETHGPA